MTNKLKLLATLILLAACEKQEPEPDCNCQKITKIAFDIYNIEDVPCQPETEGKNEEGRRFYITCKE